MSLGTGDFAASSVQHFSARLIAVLADIQLILSSLHARRLTGKLMIKACSLEGLAISSKRSQRLIGHLQDGVRCDDDKKELEHGLLVYRYFVWEMLARKVWHKLSCCQTKDSCIIRINYKVAN